MRQRDIIEVTIIDFIHGTRFHVSKPVLGICPHKALHQRLMFFKIMSHRQRTIMCQVDNNSNHASKNNAKYMPMIFFYFLKIIFDISTSKRSNKYKPHSILAKKKKLKFAEKQVEQQSQTLPQGRRVRCKDPVIEIDQSIPKLSNQKIRTEFNQKKKKEKKIRTESKRK